MRAERDAGIYFKHVRELVNEELNTENHFEEEKALERAFREKQANFF